MRELLFNEFRLHEMAQEIHNNPIQRNNIKNTSL